MKFIVGLGNPGTKYQNNRHNVGHMFAEYVSKQVKSVKFKIIKTDCFMNQSGSFVKKLVENWSLKIENLVVVHDDLDIPLGKFKIQKRSGPKLHNGITSIENTLGTKDFWRVRIGVDNPSTRFTHQGHVRIDGEAYVLQDFNPKESKTMLQTFPHVFRQLLNIIGV